jgi:hypothetical protein
MLSEKDTNEVVKFLQTFVQTSNVVSNECIMDGGGALHSAASIAFNNMTLDEYASEAFKILKLNKNNKLKCCLRIDRNHFVKMIVRWSKKNITDAYIRKVFCNILCKLVDETNILKIANIIAMLLYICTSKIDTIITIQCKVSLQDYVRDNLFEIPLLLVYR